MQRSIVEPADVSGSELSELKAWLGITRPQDDEMLIGLLQSSLDMFEGYSGQIALSQLVEERVPTKAGRHNLSSRPMIAVEAVEAIVADGTRSALAIEAYRFELTASGSADFQLTADVDGQAVAVRMRVGLAMDWNAMPAAVRQGVIRLAGHLYRDRDVTGGSKLNSAPPSSVTALWRPWRTIRLQ